jgi:cobalt/nickel transport system permease protein
MLGHDESTLRNKRSFPYIDRVDPRLRITASVLLSVAVAAAPGIAGPAIALTAAIAGLSLCGLSPPMILRRLLPLELVCLLLFAVLPLTHEGTPLYAWGPLEPSVEGLELAALIAVKGNAIVLTLLVTLGSMEMTTLGHALSHLHVPDKLAHLLLFTIRYLEELKREYARLADAMRVRAFRPRMDRHTYRSYGYLAGMLLVRSFDRSERIVWAMKCRGFRGRFYLLDHFAMSRSDVPFAIAAVLLLSAIIYVEWA